MGEAASTWGDSEGRDGDTWELRGQLRVSSSSELLCWPRRRRSRLRWRGRVDFVLRGILQWDVIGSARVSSTWVRSESAGGVATSICQRAMLVSGTKRAASSSRACVRTSARLHLRRCICILDSVSHQVGIYDLWLEAGHKSTTSVYSNLVSTM